MVGLTYTTFKPGDFCYIVLFNPHLFSTQTEAEFLEWEVKKFNSTPRMVSASHPITNFLQASAQTVYTINAKVSYDPYVAARDPLDLTLLSQEPEQPYVVIHPRDHVRNLEKLLRLRDKMHVVELHRIHSLETALRFPQSRTK